MTRLTNKEFGDQPIGTQQTQVCPDPVSNIVTTEYYGGLTKREYFAIQILKGLCVPCIPGAHNNPEATVRDLPPHAVLLADALINELNKEVK